MTTRGSRGGLLEVLATIPGGTQVSEVIGGVRARGGAGDGGRPPRSVDSMLFVNLPYRSSDKRETSRNT